MTFYTFYQVGARVSCIPVFTKGDNFLFLPARACKARHMLAWCCNQPWPTSVCQHRAPITPKTHLPGSHPLSLYATLPPLPPLFVSSRTAPPRQNNTIIRRIGQMNNIHPTPLSPLFARGNDAQDCESRFSTLCFPY